jgi:hypothetical protein
MLMHVNIISFRIKAVILLAAFMLYYTAVSGQMTLSVDSYSSCENTTVFVPLYVSDFTNVNAITLYLTIDTAVIRFVELANPHPDLAGGTLMGNSSTNNDTISLIIITWWRLSSLTIQEGKLLDLVLDYKQGSSEIKFTNCEIAQDTNVVEGVIYQHGAVLPLINQHPQDLIQTEGESAIFTVNQSHESTYLWQVNSGPGWSNLQNNPPYSNTDTYQLNIENLTQNLNNNQYRCVVTNINCQMVSNPALLMVSPLSVKEPYVNPVSISIYPIPGNRKINYKVSTNLKNITISIVNLLGRSVYSSHLDELQAGFTETIITDSLNPGLYFFQLIQDNAILSTAKIIIK